MIVNIINKKANQVLWGQTISFFNWLETLDKKLTSFYRKLLVFIYGVRISYLNILKNNIDLNAHTSYDENKNYAVMCGTI